MTFLTELLVLSISKFLPVLTELHHNHSSPKKDGLCASVEKKCSFVYWSQLMKNMVFHPFVGENYTTHNSSVSYDC